MAVVKLGKPVKSNLGGDNGAMAYIINPAKTDGGRLVSSNYERTRTDHDALAEGMLDDNRRSPKGIRKNSRLAYHIKLSFSPDDPVTPERLPLRYGVSPAQQRWYQAQARRLDRLAGEAKALNAAIRWTRLAGGDAAKGLSLLRGKVRESHDELQSAVIALHDAIQQGDPDLVAETRGEMERREALCDRYEDELSAIEREIHTTRDREQTETEQRERQQQHKRGRSI